MKTMTIGTSRKQEDLKVVSFAGSLSHGISHHNCLFNHRFINYNRVFSSKIGTHVMKCTSSVECIGSRINLGLVDL